MNICKVELIPVIEARQLLEKAGMKVTQEEAAAILEFVVQMAEIAYSNFILGTPEE